MPRTIWARAARWLRGALGGGAACTVLAFGAGSAAHAQLLDEVEWRRRGDDAVLQVRFVVPVQLQRVAASRGNDQWTVFYRVLPSAEPAPGGGAERLVPPRDGGVPGVRASDETAIAARHSPDRRLVLRLQPGLLLKPRPGLDARSIEFVAEGRGRRLPLPADRAADEAGGARYRLVLLRGDAATVAGAPAVPAPLQQQTLSLSQRVVEGHLVAELSLGPFATRREAEAALRQLRSRFPLAVIELEPVADAAAAAVAASASSPASSPASAPASASSAAPADTAAAAPAVVTPTTPDEAANEAAARLASAREALASGAAQAAITMLSRILELPPTPSTRAAQALLGEARLKAGDTGRARAEFEAFLKLYPEGDDSRRVRELLTALGQAPVAAAPARPRIEVLDVRSGSASLFYYGGQSKVRTQDFTDSLLGGLPVLVTDATLSGVDQSLAIASVDLNWRYRDSELDRRFVFRHSATRDFDRPDKSRQRLSALYLDERRPGTGLAYRLGRQSPLGSGVLSRFDGAQASYTFRPRWKLHGVAGVPTEKLLDARRWFAGASIEAEALLPQLGATFYGVEQRIDGFVDRRAVGSEWRWFDGGVQGTAQFDYDVALKAMNIVSLQGSWQRADNAQLNLLYDRRATPLLSLGNALFFTLPTGVFARRVTELVEAGTPLQLLQRQVRDTTAQSTQASVGGTLPLSPHWQIGADLRFSNIGAIAPVPELLPLGQPSSGDVWSANLQFIGLNLYSARDTHVFMANQISGPGFSGQLLTYQNSTALNASWQLDPSLKWYHQRSSDGSTSTRWSPGLRATWRVTPQATLEGELSIESSRFEGNLRNETSRRSFFYLGAGMTSEPALPLLQVQGLAIERGGRPLLAGIGFEMHPGALTWLRGRNGRGKTSLLRVLAGLADAAAGSLRWRGACVWVGHGAALKDELSVDENLAFMAQVQGWHADATRRRDALGAFGLASLASRPGRALSQGQRRRVALARLLLAPARALWLLDEPADALDDDGAHRLATLLGAHAHSGGAALWTSHVALPASDPVAAVIDLDAAVFDPQSRR